VPGEAASPDEVMAELRELMAERNAQVAVPAGELVEQRALGAGLTAQVEALAARVKRNLRNSGKPPSSDGLPKVKVEVTEHQLFERACPCCG
jgi:Family of unknown function (DUF6444)